MLDKLSLKGKHALITGGSRGIGLSIVKTFLEVGANVTFFSRKKENVQQALESLAKKWPRPGVDVLLIFLLLLAWNLLPIKGYTPFQRPGP